MWKKIKPYIIGIFTGIGAILKVIIGRRSANITDTGNTNLSSDNTRIRQGFDDSGERLDKLTDNNESAENTIRTGKDSIGKTRKTVSELIRKGKNQN